MITPSTVQGLNVMKINSEGSDLFVVSGYTNAYTHKTMMNEFAHCNGQSIEDFKKSDRYKEALDKLVKKLNDYLNDEFRHQCMHNELSFEEKYEILKQVTINQVHNL